MDTSAHDPNARPAGEQAPSVSLRPARTDEHPDLCRAMAAIDPWQTLGITAEALTGAFARDAELRRVVVAERGGAIAGVIAFRTVRGLEWIINIGGGKALAAVTGDMPPDGGYVNCLAVFPGNQGCGAGHLLMDRAEEETSRDSDRIYLCVSDFNAGARKFYERRGYREAARIRDCIRPGMDELVMVRELTRAR